MIVAFDINAVREYSLRSDDGPEKTVFHIGRIDSILRSHIMDSTTRFAKEGEKSDRVEAEVDISKRFYLLAQFGVKGWKGFKDSAGNEVPFDQVSVPVPGVGNRMGLSERTLNLLQPYLSELALEVLGDNELSAEREKN